MNISVHENIKVKLFAVMASVLLLSLLFILLFGSFFMELYFNVTTSMELEEQGRLIHSAYKNDPDGIYTILDELEHKNTFIMIYVTDGSGRSTIYISRPERFRRQETTMAAFVLGSGIGSINMEELVVGQTAIIGVHEKERPTIMLQMKLEEGVFLIAETPKEFLQDVSQRAVMFTAIVSSIMFFIGGIVIFLLAGAITAPIRVIQNTADKIANLDFSQQCMVDSKDELGHLASSINNMSARLQDNITKLTQANETLTSQLLQRERMEKSRREFIANVSHDLKTPLTLVISYCEEMKNQIAAGASPDPQYFEIICQESERMSALVMQMLQLSQLESPAMELDRSIFAINEIIDATIYKNKLVAAQRGIAVSMKTEDSFIVHADFLRAEQVFSNLFENALKYCQEGGNIAIQVGRRGSKCHITVENTGAPIREEDMESLFQSFYKVDKSRSIEGASYGLGLAIVKTIMDLHGEAYGVMNTEQGVLFYFDLPCVDLEEEEAAF